MESRPDPSELASSLVRGGVLARACPVSDVVARADGAFTAGFLAVMRSIGALVVSLAFARRGKWLCVSRNKTWLNMPSIRCGFWLSRVRPHDATQTRSAIAKRPRWRRRGPVFDLLVSFCNAIRSKRSVPPHTVNSTYRIAASPSREQCHTLPDLDEPRCHSIQLSRATYSNVGESSGVFLKQERQSTID